MTMDDNLQMDLDSLARKVIHRMDRRNQVAPRQPVTRIATQANGLVVTNKHRVLNIVSNGANVVADPTVGRANIVIPCGYLYCVIDGGGLPIVASGNPQASIHIHDNLQIVQWSLIANTTGSIFLDLRSCPFGSYPSTNSIVAGTNPGLSGTQTNTQLTPTVALGGTPWTPLLVDDILDIMVSASTIVTRVTLILKCQATG